MLPMRSAAPAIMPVVRNVFIACLQLSDQFGQAHNHQG
jgi:hypothetical protein